MIDGILESVRNRYVKLHLTEPTFARKMQAFMIYGILESVRNRGVKLHLTEPTFARKMFTAVAVTRQQAVKHLLGSAGRGCEASATVSPRPLTEPLVGRV